MANDDSNRPGIAFRVGVTGAVSIDPENANRLRNEVARLLQSIKAQIDAICGTLQAQTVYNAATPRLRMVSSLAEGADRIVAEGALKAGFALEAILPFAAQEFETTFGKTPFLGHDESVRAFRSLLDRAGKACVVLDGSVDDDNRALSYEAAGRCVVRNCDLLIALWDDKRIPKGIGGTVDTVRYALRAGVPVCWLNTQTTRPMRWLTSIMDLPGGRQDEANDATAAMTALSNYISQAVTPPGTARSVGLFRKRLQVRDDDLRRYFREVEKPNRNYWALHQKWLESTRGVGRWLYYRAVWKPDARHWAAPRTYNLVAIISRLVARNTIRASSSRASRLAIIAQQRYRTSYLLVFVLGAIALVSAVIGLAYHSLEPICLAIELGALAVVLILVIANLMGRWHKKYISYRILGEMLRASSLMLKIGWELPGYRAGNLARSTERAWVGWLFAALVRDGTLRSIAFTPVELANIRDQIEKEFLSNQITFHRFRSIDNRAAGRLLAHGGTLLFGAALILVVARVVAVYLHADEVWVKILTVASAIVPAISAAFFGIRAYEELELLAQQSSHMAEALDEVSRSIDRLDLSMPLASQVLGTQFAEIAALMLADVEGWAQLYRLKGVEA